VLCLLSASKHHDWILLLLMEIGPKLRTQIFCYGLPQILRGYHILMYTHCRALIKSVASDGSSLQVMVMKMMVVWHFVSDSHKSCMTTIHCHILPSNQFLHNLMDIFCMFGKLCMMTTHCHILPSNQFLYSFMDIFCMFGVVPCW
jgi:hypothetical protein